ncbi:MAG TPA: alcohol dehydrogenase [Candidatus Thorarchaeota archaeon]|nr:alcohol dehydrogenase [Candidatus Thorarchaeota archaeon]
MRIQSEEVMYRIATLSFLGCIVKSLILTRDGLQLADTPMPSIMPGEVRIEVRSVGICTTDIAIWRGEYEVELPLILGHEITGVVHESSVPELEPGTPVTTEIDVYCGRCWFCRHGQPHHCPERKTLGVTTDGGLAEYVSVPSDLVHALPPSVDTVTGVFTEPLASAIETVRRAEAEKDEVVVVLGTGKIGLLVAQAYDAYGAEVYLVGRNQWKLGLARRIGLRYAINTNSHDWKDQILDVTSGVGPRVVVEATGTPDGMAMALNLVRPGGIIAVKSIHGATFPVSVAEIVRKEITLIGSRSGPFDVALDMLDKGRIEVKSLISAQFALDDGAKAFEYASRPEATKVVINI